MELKFRPVYDAFKMCFCNPDSNDVLEFMYIHEQILKGRSLDEIDEETEEYMEETGYRFPPEYKKLVRERDKTY